MQEIKKWNRADSLIDLESYLASLVSEKYRIGGVVVTKTEFARVESIYVPFEVLVVVEKKVTVFR